MAVDRIISKLQPEDTIANGEIGRWGEDLTVFGPEKPRYESPCGPAVIAPGGTEGLGQVRFFHAELAPIGSCGQEEAEQRVPLPGYESRRGIHAEDRGVDGMTDEAVGAGLDQLMVHLDGDSAAPVASEMAARPDGQKHRTYLEGQTDGDEDGGGRQVAPGQAGDRDEEKQQGCVHHEHVETARGRGFGTFFAGRVLSRNLPVNAEENPDRARGPKRPVQLERCPDSRRGRRRHVEYPVNEQAE